MNGTETCKGQTTNNHFCIITSGPLSTALSFPWDFFLFSPVILFAFPQELCKKIRCDFFHLLSGGACSPKFTKASEHKHRNIILYINRLIYFVTKDVWIRPFQCCGNGSRYLCFIITQAAHVAYIRFPDTLLLNVNSIIKLEALLVEACAWQPAPHAPSYHRYEKQIYRSK